MKVRVPVEHRPPERFKPMWDLAYGMWFKVKGEYRVPKKGEYFWGIRAKEPILCFFPMQDSRAILVSVEDAEDPTR